MGLGPLHTQFGPDGWAYTSLFVDSAIAKWKLGTWEVVDKVPMSYSIGHLTAAEGDTVAVNLIDTGCGMDGMCSPCVLPHATAVCAGPVPTCSSQWRSTSPGDTIDVGGVE